MTGQGLSYSEPTNDNNQYDDVADDNRQEGEDQCTNAQHHFSGRYTTRPA